MNLLLSMIPVYLFGNLHCFGMCGPLVMMIGQHRFRALYFAGRLLSFSIAGLLAGEAGAIINIFLHRFHLGAITSFLFGGLILLIGITTLTPWKLPSIPWISLRMNRVSESLSLLMLRDQPWPTFLFGFFTVALPCGQTLLVFSACALYGDAWVGFLNGFTFALLTSPSLFFAMYAVRFLHNAKKYYHTVVGMCAVIVGAVAICRGCAEMGWISHWILNPESNEKFHIVMF